MAKALELIAPAKVNLCLHVRGRDSSGYHQLDSLAAFTEVGDVLRLEPDTQLTFTVEGEFAAPLINDTEPNLVVKAAEALRWALGIQAGARITLIKALPVGAGLGGGSADAAAALRGLQALWGAKLPAPALQELALRLGSDVPACMVARPVWIRGIGEDISPARIPSGGAVLLANAGQPLLTARVYQALTPPYSSAVKPLSEGQGWECFAQWLSLQHNALERPATALMPAIRGLLAAMARTPGCLLARMSGSGATCFGLFTELSQACMARDSLRARFPGMWVMASRWRAYG